MDTHDSEICITNVRQHVQAGAPLVDVREHRDVQALAFDTPGVVHIPVIGKRFNSFDKEQEP